MNPDLHDNTWLYCGTSLLWEAEALNHICSAEAVRSLREFLLLHQAGWPDDTLRLSNNRTLVVAGLEAAMDTLHPAKAIEWIEQKVYPAVLDFQESVADGGREAALILWLADHKRIFHLPSENTYHWHCSAAHRKQSIPLGRCIWNGAESSARRIVTKDTAKKEIWAGLFQARIS
ncbi:MAG: hypothetical protein R3B95_18495 [Nitrospirales bacterium]|nr:hypothetical protein [Nitrospirales bacterium]